MSTYNKVLVVGAGLTSAVATFKLSAALPQVHVWDKSRGAGGRMSTSRSPNNPECKVDIGAQYVSTPSQPSQQVHQDIYEELISSGILQSIDPKEINGFRRGEIEMNHYVAPNGMSSLVKHFFNRSGVSIDFNHRLVDLSLKEDKWSARSEDGKQEDYEAVIITMPVPQVLELTGDISNIIGNNDTLIHNLKSVKYSSRFVLAVFFDEKVDLGVEWIVKYITNHPIFRYVAVDNLKRGDKSGATSVLAHASVPFSMDKIEEKPENIKLELLKSLEEIFPVWPKPSFVKCHKWRYSQVTQSYPGQPGSLVINTKPLLVLAGDAFAPTSNCDGCLNSAKSASSHVLKQ